MEAAWPKNPLPIYIPLLQHQRFSFPVDISFGWHPYQYKYWNILFLDSTTI